MKVAMAEQSTNMRGPLLPKTHVLNYVARVSTPTRVRKIAATCSVVIAVVYFALAVTLGEWLFTVTGKLVIARRVFRPFGRGRGRLPPPPTSLWDYVDVVRLEFKENPLLFLALAGCLLLGGLAIVLARPVKRGMRTASYFVLASAAPLMILIAIVTAAFTAAGVVDVFGLAPPAKIGIRLVLPGCASGGVRNPAYGGFLLLSAMDRPQPDHREAAGSVSSEKITQTSTAQHPLSLLDTRRFRV